MPAPNASRVSIQANASDADLERRALKREGQAFRAIMTHYNQQLYRLAALAGQ